MKKPALTLIPKHLAVVAALACVAGARAEDGLKVYGILDAGVAVQQYGLPANATFAPGLNDYSPQKVSNPNVTGQTGVLNGPLSDPRIGLTGTKSIRDGWHAGFNLESGFDLTSGQLNNHAQAQAQNSGIANPVSTNAESSLDGQLFNRSAYVSLGKDGWGDIRVGRNTALITDTLAAFDPLQLSQAFSPLGFSGVIGGGIGASNNLRQDNSLKYLNQTGNFRYGLSLETGNGTGVAQQGGGFGAMLQYGSGPLKVAGVYQNARDAIQIAGAGSAPAAANQVSISAYNLEGYMFNVAYEATEKFTIKAGYESYTYKAASDAVSISSFGTSIYGIGIYAASPTANLSYTGVDKTVVVYYAGGDYKLTPELRLFAAQYVVTPQSYTQSSGAYTPGATNVYTSLLADYTIDSSWDVYAGLSFQTYSDTATPNSPNVGMYSSNYLYAMGARYRF